MIVKEIIFSISLAVIFAETASNSGPKVEVVPMGTEGDKPSFLSLQRFTLQGPGSQRFSVVGKTLLSYPTTTIWDRDHDSWPDGWVRERGPNFPRFPKVYVYMEDSVSSGFGGSGASPAGSLLPENQNRAFEGRILGSSPGFESVDLSPDHVTAEKESTSPRQSLCIEPEGGNVAIAYRMPWIGGFQYLLYLQVRSQEFRGTFWAELSVFQPDLITTPVRVARYLCLPWESASWREPPKDFQGWAGRTGPAAFLKEPEIRQESEGFTQESELPSQTSELWVALSHDGVGSAEKGFEGELIVRLIVIPAGRHLPRGKIWIDRLDLWRVPHVRISLGQQLGSFRAVDQIVGKMSLWWEGPAPSAELELRNRNEESRLRFSVPLTRVSQILKAQLRGKSTSSVDDRRAVLLASGEVSGRDWGKSLSNPPNGASPRPTPSVKVDTSDDNFIAADDVFGLYEGKFELPKVDPGFYWLRVKLTSSLNGLSHEYCHGITVLPDVLSSSQDSSGVNPGFVALGEIGHRRHFGWSLPEWLPLVYGAPALGKALTSGAELLRWEWWDDPPSVWNDTTRKIVGPVSFPAASSSSLGEGLLIVRPRAEVNDLLRRWSIDELFSLDPNLDRIRWIQLGDEKHPWARSSKEAQGELNRLGQAGAQPGTKILVLMPYEETTGQSHLPSGAGAGMAQEEALAIIRDAVMMAMGVEPGERLPPTQGPRDGQGVSLKAASVYQQLRIASVELPARGGDPTRIAGSLLQGLCRAVAGNCRWCFIRFTESNFHQVFAPPGMPGELIAPWLVGTELLRTAEFLRSLDLGHGVSALLFRRGDDALLALWSDQPKEVLLVVPEGGSLINGWAQVTALPPTGEPIGLPVDTMPVFLLTGHLWPFLWQHFAGFEPGELRPEPGRSQRFTVHFRNTTDLSVAGELRVQPPPGFRIMPEKFHFVLEPNAVFAQPVEIVTAPHAVGGLQRFRWEFAWEKPVLRRLVVVRDIPLRWPGLIVTAYLQQAGERSWVEIKLSNDSGEPLPLIVEVFSSERKRAGLPPRVFGPGLHHVEVPLEFAGNNRFEEMVVQVRDAEGPRRLRLPVYRVPTAAPPADTELSGDGRVEKSTSVRTGAVPGPAVNDR